MMRIYEVIIPRMKIAGQWTGQLHCMVRILQRRKSVNIQRPIRCLSKCLETLQNLPKLRLRVPVAVPHQQPMPQMTKDINKPRGFEGARMDKVL